MRFPIIAIELILRSIKILGSALHRKLMNGGIFKTGELIRVRGNLYIYNSNVGVLMTTLAILTHENLGLRRLWLCHSRRVFREQ